MVEGTPAGLLHVVPLRSGSAAPAALQGLPFKAACVEATDEVWECGSVHRRTCACNWDDCTRVANASAPDAHPLSSWNLVP